MKFKNQCQGFSDVIQRFDNLKLSDIAWFPFESECKVIFFSFIDMNIAIM